MALVKRNASEIVVKGNNLLLVVAFIIASVLFGAGLVYYLGEVGGLEFFCYKKNPELTTTDCTVTFRPRFQIFPTKESQYFEIKEFDCQRRRSGKAVFYDFILYGNQSAEKIPLSNCSSWGSKRAEELNAFLQSPQKDISFVEYNGIDWVELLLLLLPFVIFSSFSIILVLFFITVTITINLPLRTVTHEEKGLLFSHKKVYPLADVDCVKVVIVRGKKESYKVQILFKTNRESLFIASKSQWGEAERLAREIGEFIGCRLDLTSQGN
ncbi:MAG: hypothetical protein NZ901_04155 [Geminocystis sp.]|nr:hypothetical protein [Geminocystis sp.]MCS7147365.1 hypothetical protein [Geminocystis sp.]MDW8116364.1 hypothetical protein [Geminocystis sp.]MDW8462646.1 hypothetical protein [Geminocystis sp.]